MTKNLNFYIALLMLVFIVVFGISGFMIIERFRFLDALYMTIITIATVGFKELHDLSDGGKIFTIILIILALLIIAYSVTTITSHFLEERLSAILKGYRKQGGIKKMNEHIIIVGFGRNGQQVYHDLKRMKESVLVIEKNTEIIQLHRDQDIIFIEGDATEDEVLTNAGILKAKALITTLPNDADNTYVVLTARSLCKKLRIIARASHESSQKKLITAGADHVIMPEKVGGTYMANLIAKPDLSEFYHHLSIEGNEGVNLVEVVCSELPDQYKNHTIHDLSIRRLTGANIVGFRTPGGQYIINPGGNTIMAPEAKLFVLGTPDQIEKVREIIRVGNK